MEYILADKIEYALKGENQEAMFVELKTPRARNISMIAPLKQAFTIAITSNQQLMNASESAQPAESSDDSEEMTGAMVIAMIEACPAIDMSKFVLDARTLILKTELFQIDGETKFTAPLLDLISIPDFYGMVGEFLRVFIIASLLKA